MENRATHSKDILMRKIRSIHLFYMTCVINYHKDRRYPSLNLNNLHVSTEFQTKISANLCNQLYIERLMWCRWKRFQSIQLLLSLYFSKVTYFLWPETKVVLCLSSRKKKEKRKLKERIDYSPHTHTHQNNFPGGKWWFHVITSKLHTTYTMTHSFV